VGVTITVECQKCEAVHSEELKGVLVLGKKLNNGEAGTYLYYHDLSDSELLEILSDMLKYLAEQRKE